MSSPITLPYGFPHWSQSSSSALHLQTSRSFLITSNDMTSQDKPSESTPLINRRMLGTLALGATLTACGAVVATQSPHPPSPANLRTLQSRKARRPASPSLSKTKANWATNGFATE